MLDRFNTLLVALQARLQAEEGQTMAEYALILGLIVVVTAAAFTALGGSIHNTITSICTSIGGSPTGGCK
jgi:Flp pilus assembly pilin Flp